MSAKDTIYNWRWWVVLPYMLPWLIVIFLLATLEFMIERFFSWLDGLEHIDRLVNWVFQDDEEVSED